jgi:hypothetical protein
MGCGQKPLTPALSQREREPIFSVTKICFCF